jgi:hypothetical protein
MRKWFILVGYFTKLHRLQKLSAGVRVSTIIYCDNEKILCLPACNIGKFTSTNWGIPQEDENLET